jgi:hypothetical protein
MCNEAISLSEAKQLKIEPGDRFGKNRLARFFCRMLPDGYISSPGPTLRFGQAGMLRDPQMHHENGYSPLRSTTGCHSASGIFALFS